MNIKKVLALPTELISNCIYLVHESEAEFVSVYISSADGTSAKKVLNIDDVKDLLKSLNPDASDIIQFKDDLDSIKLELSLLENLKTLDVDYLTEIKNLIVDIQGDLDKKIEQDVIQSINVKLDKLKTLIDSIDVEYLSSVEGMVTRFGVELNDKVSFNDIQLLINQINSLSQIMSDKVDINTFNELKSIIDSIDFRLLESYQQNLSGIVEALNDKVNFNTFDDLRNTVTNLEEKINNITFDGFTDKPIHNVKPKLVNSIPLYTLDNNGDYVLCKPDVWLDVNGYYIPAYLKETLNLQ